MSGSIFGKNFQISTWGESHGKALGVVIDGCPSGLSLCEDDIQIDLNKRKPGTSKFSTPRKEDDKVEILSGVFEGKTTGTPISLIIYNTNQRSNDYSDIAEYYRPGHADLVYDMKYGFRDYRGGGRSSARETAARVAAGAVAKKILNELNINILTYTQSIGDIYVNEAKLDIEEKNNNPLVMPDKIAYEKAAELIEQQRIDCNSVGGTVKCIVNNMPYGVGEPVFDRLDALLGKALFSINAVKGVEFGSGFQASHMFGSENNDQYKYENNNIIKLSNNAGGILGGISDTSPIAMTIAFKPTPSIHKVQKTINKSNDNIEVQINGRHDPVVVPRAVIVVEAMVCITLVDCLFQSMTSQLSSIKKFFMR